MTTTEKVQAHLQAADLSRAVRSIVAEEFCTSVSTLARRLSDEGTTLGTLVKLERQRRLALLLDSGAATGYQVYGALGYLQVNSFYRAYQAWFGRAFSERQGKPK